MDRRGRHHRPADLAAGPDPWRPSAGGLLVELRVTPNAAADRIEGVEVRADGRAVLRLRVRAVPDKGRANAAVVALLAKALGVPRSAVTIASGETARDKTVALAGDGPALAARLAALAAPRLSHARPETPGNGGTAAR